MPLRLEEKRVSLSCAALVMIFDAGADAGDLARGRRRPEAVVREMSRRRTDGFS